MFRHKKYRNNNRLHNFNYSSDAMYFVTICTQNQQPIFGNIVGRQMKLSQIGRICKWCWESIPGHFDTVKLDEFQVMPDHFHGIIRLERTVGAPHVEPLQHNIDSVRQHSSLGQIIQSFKSSVTRIARHQIPGIKIWQRNYHDHIIRNEPELDHYRQYIIDNPKI